MARKLSLLAVATGTVLAFAFPSMSNAAQVTCGWPASTCPVGTVVTATGTNFTLNTEFHGNTTCKGVNLKFTLTKNNEGVVTAESASEKPSQSCPPPPESLEFSTFKIYRLEMNEASGPSGATKNGTWTFIDKTKTPNGATCEWIGTNVPFQYTSTASPAVLTSTDPSTRKNITSNGGCGKAQLLGEFKLETFSSGGTAIPVILH